MTKGYFPSDFLGMLRNQIPIDTVIASFLNMETRNTHNLFRFQCPLCGRFHTAVNHKTNLARCFHCKQNFNPIDMVMVTTKSSFIDAVQFLEDKINP